MKMASFAMLIGSVVITRRTKKYGHDQHQSSHQLFLSHWSSNIAFEAAADVFLPCML
jgi:hypothetical protein